MAIKITREEYKRKFGVAPDFSSKVSPSSQPSSSGFMDRAKNVINEAGTKYDDQIRGQGEYAGQSDVTRGVGAFATAFGAPLKVGFEALPETKNFSFRSGLSSLGNKIGQKFKEATDALAGTKLFKEVGELEAEGYVDTAPLRNALQLSSSSGEIAGEVLAYGQAAQGIQGAVNTTKKVAQNTTKATTEALGSMGNKTTNSIRSQLSEQPAKIMQRVARISKGKQAKFEQMAGEGIGDYLTKRGIYGNIDDISEQLYKRFNQSKGVADNALAQLKGTFNPSPVRTMVKDLLAREGRVSSAGAPSPILREVKVLASKMDKGWTMSEINQIKRLYERNIKVDYLKQNLPESVARATNLDSAVRKWQIQQAKNLGLKNLDVINKETQLAKRLLNDLGIEYAGAAGNNAMTLTDWIMLSGGDPAAIAGFLTKKVLSSKGVMSSIAKNLNKGKATMGPVKADLGPTQVRKLPSPPGGSPRSQIGSGQPIPVAPQGSNMEFMKQGVSSRTKPPAPLSPQKGLETSSSNSNVMPKKINWQGGYVKNPFADIPSNDWKFLSDFANKVANKEFVSKSDYAVIRAIFKENNLEIPKTPRKTADYISTVNEAIAQRAVNAELDANLSKVKTPQPRDTIGRYDKK